MEDKGSAASYNGYSHFQLACFHNWKRTGIQGAAKLYTRVIENANDKQTLLNFSPQ